MGSLRCFSVFFSVPFFLPSSFLLNLCLLKVSSNLNDENLHPDMNRPLRRSTDPNHVITDIVVIKLS